MNGDESNTDLSLPSNLSHPESDRPLEGEELLSTLLAQIPAQISATWGPEHRFIFQNPLHRQFHEGQDFLQKTPREVFSQNLLPRLLDLFERVYTRGETLTLKELPFPRQLPQPHTAYLSLQAQPLTDRRGEIRGVLTLSHEVTEQVLAREETARQARLSEEQAEERRLTREQEIRAEVGDHRSRILALLARVPASISIKSGPSHIFEYANELYLRRSGKRDVTEILGKPFAQVFPERHEQLAILDRVYRQKQPVKGKEIIVPRKKDQDQEPSEADFVNFVVEPLFDLAGQIEGTITFAVDVTGQVLARQRVEALVEKLKSQQKWLEDLLNLLPTPLLLIEPETARVDFANKAADQIAGGAFPQSAQERSQHRYTDVEGKPIPEDQIPRARAARGERLRGFYMDWHMPSGKKSIRVYSELIPTEDGQPARAVVTFDDITHLKQVEANLQQAVQARDEFLSIAAHELRTPTTAMRLQLQSLLRAIKRPPQIPLSALVEQRVQKAIEQLDRLMDLVDDLLDVSRIAARRLKLSRERLDLVEVVRDVIERFRDQLGATPLTLHTEGPVVGYWDRLRLDQVCINLLSNAIKYGRGQPIEISVEAQRGQVRLMVRDHGIGISLQDQARIFQRFERAASERHYGGMGLGLWITNQIVETMGGQIEVQSDIGQGATFVVTLPLSAEGSAR